MKAVNSLAKVRYDMYGWTRVDRPYRAYLTPSLLMGRCDCGVWVDGCLPLAHPYTPCLTRPSPRLAQAYNMLDKKIQAESMYCRLVSCKVRYDIYG